MNITGRMSTLVALTALAAAAACNGATGDASARTTAGAGIVPVSVAPRQQDYRVVATYNHDPEAWTQGLVFHEGVLYEGTGQEGRSSLREVEIATGVVKRQLKMADSLFGEGIALVGDQIFQLTWQNKIGYVYDRATFRETGSWSYDYEGWGLTYDGTHLILSDGSAMLRYINPRTMAVLKTIEVKDDGRPVLNVNELEMVKGELWANIWMSDSIARIDPKTGTVHGWINLAGILPESERSRYENVDVLNGIAYDPVGDRIFVTGKRWPKLYEIKLVPVE